MIINLFTDVRADMTRSRILDTIIFTIRVEDLWDCLAIPATPNVWTEERRHRTREALDDMCQGLRCAYIRKHMRTIQRFGEDGPEFCNVVEIGQVTFSTPWVGYSKYLFCNPVAEKRKLEAIVLTQHSNQYATRKKKRISRLRERSRRDTQADA